MSVKSDGTRYRKAPNISSSGTPTWPPNGGVEGASEAGVSKSVQYRFTAACLVFLSVWLTWTLSGPTGNALFFSAAPPRQMSFTVQQQQDILERCAAIRTT